MVQVSVVVPTFRRPQLLDQCIKALVAQDLDPSIFEVLIVDDGADPDTRRAVERWHHGYPNVRYVPVPGPAHGPAAARNLGWQAAVGEIIAFTDDDCLPQPGWLRSGLATFDRNVVAAWGRLVMPIPRKPTDYEKNAARLARAVFVTANCFCRRKALEETGGFDERFTSAWREDSDLHFSLLEKYGRIAYVPGAVVVHPVRPAAWGISVKQQRNNRFEALLYKKHPALYKRFFPNIPWRYYVSVLALLITVLSAAMGLVALALASINAWLLLTARICGLRLKGTSRSPRHVAEMLVTSLLIPPVSVFWRLWGAWRYRVWFM